MAGRQRGPGIMPAIRSDVPGHAIMNRNGEGGGVQPGGLGSPELPFPFRRQIRFASGLGGLLRNRQGLLSCRQTQPGSATQKQSAPILSGPVSPIHGAPTSRPAGCCRPAQRSCRCAQREHPAPRPRSRRCLPPVLPAAPRGLKFLSAVLPTSTALRGQLSPKGSAELRRQT